jgi:transcriptional regulator with XRE-family HTH domain
LKVHEQNYIGKPFRLSIGKPIAPIGKVIAMDSRTRTAFGRRLFEARTAAKLSQGQVCKKIGIKQGTLSELENEAHRSSYTPALAALYGVSALWLAEGKGGEKESSVDSRFAEELELDASKKQLLAYFDGLSPGHKMAILDLAKTLYVIDKTGQQDVPWNGVERRAAVRFELPDKD